MRKRACFFALVASLAGGAAAQPLHLTPSPWRTYASVGYSAGGDVWVKGAYRDSKETYSIKAGQGMQAMVGAQYQMAQDWYVQGAVGFHQDRTNGSDGNYFFTRWPLELAVYRALRPEWRVGVGVRHASRARFKSEGVVQAFGTYSLKTVPGPLVEVQYFLVPLRESGPGRGASGGLSLRWVDEKFKSDGPWKVERDGQHWALTAFAYF